MKWKEASGILCDHRISIRWKDKFHKTELGLQWCIDWSVEHWIGRYKIYSMSMPEMRM